MALETFGIDLGTTYSVLACLDANGNPKIIQNAAESKDTLASAVYFPEGGDPVVGDQAKEFRDTEPDRVVECAKRYIGRDGDKARKYKIDGHEYDPIEISTLYLKRIKAYAADQGYTVENVVITCPAYFKDVQRAATRQAAELAGMKVLNIVNEPTAAALAFCKDEYPENKRIMVYDLGGGTFDVSIIEFTKRQDNTAKVEVIDSMGNDELGGRDWDSILHDIIAEKVAVECGISKEDVDLNIDLKSQITSKCEETKIALTNMTSKKVLIRYEEEKVKVTITREEFEERTKGKVQETMDFVTALLEKCNFTQDDIDLVLLVGGSTFMPMIPAAVKTIFPEGKVQSYEPNLAVAKGAAIAAKLQMEEIIRKVKQSQEEGKQITETTTGLSEETIEEIKNTDFGDEITKPGSVTLVEQKLTSSYGARVYNEFDNLIINNLLFKGGEPDSEGIGEYSTRRANQPRIVVHVYSNDAEEGDIDIDDKGNQINPDPNYNIRHLGQLELPLPEGTPKGSPISVTFRHKGIGLDVQAVNKVTKEHVEAFINFSSDGVKTKDEMKEAFEHIQNINTTHEIDE